MTKNVMRRVKTLERNSVRIQLLLKPSLMMKIEKDCKKYNSIPLRVVRAILEDYYK